MIEPYRQFKISFISLSVKWKHQKMVDRDKKKKRGDDEEGDKGTRLQIAT